MELDHIAVAGNTLEEAAAHVQDALGLPLVEGGRHDRFGTWNRLMGLQDGLYLEAIAIDPDAPAPDDARWFDLDRFSGQARLTNWICRVPDLGAALDALPQGAGRAVDLARGDLRWRMAVPETGILPHDNCFPALLEWQVARTPPDILTPQACRLTRLEIAHPQADILAATLGMADARLAFVGGAPALRASFDTPHGKRVLE